MVYHQQPAESGRGFRRRFESPAGTPLQCNKHLQDTAVSIHIYKVIGGSPRCRRRNIKANLMAEPSGAPDGVITIKKYANRRLYNTATSNYVTLEHLSRMVKNGVDFIVIDAKTHEDLTRQVLTQIITEEENKGENLLPIKFLRQIIALYGRGMQGMVPRYLDLSMDSFTRNQQQISQYMEETLTGLFPFGEKMSELSKRNMAMFEDAMRLFAPEIPPSRNKEDPMAGEARGKRPNESAEMSDLRAKLNRLQEQLDRLLKTPDSEPTDKPG